MKQPDSHDAAPRTVYASSLEINGAQACPASDLRSGSRALRNEPHRRLHPAGMLLQTDMTVVVDRDLVLGAEKTRGSERLHRALGTHHETLSASGEPAGESA
jgi:hypothetical protein